MALGYLQDLSELVEAPVASKAQPSVYAIEHRTFEEEAPYPVDLLGIDSTLPSSYSPAILSESLQSLYGIDFTLRQDVDQPENKGIALMEITNRKQVIGTQPEIVSSGKCSASSSKRATAVHDSYPCPLVEIQARTIHAIYQSSINVTDGCSQPSLSLDSANTQATSNKSDSECTLQPDSQTKCLSTLNPTAPIFTAGFRSSVPRLKQLDDSSIKHQSPLPSAAATPFSSPGSTSTCDGPLLPTADNKRLLSSTPRTTSSERDRPAPLGRLESAGLASTIEHRALTLQPRSSEAVIADLKGLRLASIDMLSTRLNVTYNGQSPAELATVSTDPLPLPISTVNMKDADDGQDQGEESDDELEIAAKPRVMTERKRKQHAVADSYINIVKIKHAKDENRILPEDESMQSTKWLIHKSESRNIISTPREYQVELFNRAKERNIIAVLDTGSGKTLIAVLLLRHIFERELEDRAMGLQRRISFFLVDSVQLVFQQHAVLKTNLDQPMNMFYGGQGCDLWSKALWQKHFSENMVIVCTAEVLRQCLHHGFIFMHQINLLIFDEAHHAKKDHPYARIIKDFYAQQQAGELKPRIFGMTASPIDARGDVGKAAAELEGIMQCEIATAEDATLLRFTGGCHETRSEIVAPYAARDPKFETSLYEEMHSRFKTNPVLRKPLCFSYEASSELGAWCSDRVWQSCLAEDEVVKLQARTERQYHAKQRQVPLAVLEESRRSIEEARKVVQTHVFEPPDFDAATSRSSNLSSKVVVLINYLRDRYERSPTDRCIVFVERRYTALVLAQLFSHPNIKTDHLSVGTLIGTSESSAGDMNVSFRDQVITMANFRKGIINCLFATSVAEEGLDVPDCNLIIRFDLYTTLIQYIQSRGRARQPNSVYIHMYEDRNQEHLQIIREVRKNENILKQFCKALPENRRLTGNNFDMDYFLSKDKKQRVYRTPTGSVLNYKISLTVLANFVDHLPHNHDIDLQPEYIMSVVNKQFVCETILPECSPVTGAVGRPASTKQVAKCSAAYETCIKLCKGKYLDEHLIPVFTKKLPAMRNALLAVNSKKTEAYTMMTKPKLWSLSGLPVQLFVTVMLLDNSSAIGRPSQPLALMTRAPLPELPSFFLHFGSNQHSSVQCITLSNTLWVTPETIEQISAFTLCLFDDVFSKLYESDIAKMPYFLAPIESNVEIGVASSVSSIIAWKVLASVNDWQSEWGQDIWANKAWQTESDVLLADRFIVDPYDGSRKLWSVGVTNEYKPLDPVPPNCAPRNGTRKNNDNILEYSCSLWAKARARRTFDADQRVFEAEYIPLRRNLLDEFDEVDEVTPKRCFIVLEPLKVSPLPTTVVAMAYVFPAIIHRVESYLIALEACELLHLNIRPDLALQAITKDSDNTDEHDAEKINFQRGMGGNYERLEFLGDCFLKMATSISLFGIKPECAEFEYHVERMLLICNKNLKNVALKLKLHEFIRSNGFNRRAWYPEGLVLRRGKATAAPNTHKLGDKTIADVSEALIGAALLSHHESKNMDDAVRAVTELVSAENHQVTSFSDYYSKLYKKPEYQTAPSLEKHKYLASEIQQVHPYTFRYPRLLQSAFIHPSYPYSWERIPSYQRLEFLGDSLLDMACVNFLFHGYPDKDPQWLTEHKMAMVSNQFLGALSVHLGFHTHLLLFNSTFHKQVTDYVTDITEARRQAEEDAVRAGKSKEDCAPDYWISIQKPPKCLPDIVEAYIGAIFVDSEFDYSEVERFFDAHIRWYFKDMSIYDSYANKHPTTFLTKFLQADMGCMDWTLTTRDIPSIDGSKPVIVALLVLHGQVVVDAQAESSRYAKVHAAKKAVAKLEGMGLPDFRAKFGCDCKAEDLLEAEDIEDLHGTAI